MTQHFSGPHQGHSRLSEQEEQKHRRQETAVWAERTVHLGKGGEVAWEEWREVWKLGAQKVVWDQIF